MKKLLFAFLLVLGLAFALNASADDMLSVYLEDADTAGFTGENGLTFYNAVTGQWLYTSAPGETVTVSGQNWGFTAAGKFNAGAEKLSVISAYQAPISWNGRKYRGYFRLDRKGGMFSVVNFVHMDNYLYSVLGREMSESFPQEALKAQAICAKNFALGERGRHGDYDLCATTHCQVYSGVDAESYATVAAVAAVSGQAAYYGGNIVPLYFFATSGGCTEDVKNVWGSDIPYLKSVQDPYEPIAQASNWGWSEVMTADEIEDKLASEGIYVGDLTDIHADGIAPTGRITALTFTGTAGRHTVYRESCRTVLGLKSQWFWIEPWYNDYGALVFTVSGRGWGHGVGMSQWGAYGMAQAGFNYIDILTHYFPGIYVQ